ncbi:Pimeloyl-ACP methyl ester carboxylesterase [Williamsia serinedens]|uniref:Pimeloyl-ACP methyl ester carboxylesterase n=1 Tax=Williamsia serinedens TaxID=391736 RepID=A0ABT1GYM2_9NOCA|nr:alpha/beta hydrolase [Williamsia serinedens]MCP2160086.1 Pimeloyl-ACP methyl ester carboxylesterase [Williamsia serinedens]
MTTGDRPQTALVDDSGDGPAVGSGAIVDTVRFAGVADVGLVGSRWTPPEAPTATALLLHGGGQTRHSWKRTGDHLAASGLRVVSMDCRGHGDSGWSPDGYYDMDILAEDVHRVIADLGGPVTLIGASLGGLTGIAVADRWGPDEVSALVLVDVVPRYDRGGTRRIRTFMRSGIDGFDSLDDAADAVAAYLPHRKRPRSIDGLTRNLRRRDDGRWYWHWDPNVISAETVARIPVDDLDDAAARLRIPIMLVRGMLSDVVPDEVLSAFRERVPHAEITELRAAGHTAAGDDNDAFSDAVVDFVGRVIRPGP